MTVGALKELLPLADVIELRPDVRYLIRCSAKLSPPRMHQILKDCAESGLKVVIVDSNFTFYDLGEATT